MPCPAANEIWGYLMPDGRTAAEVKFDTDAKFAELWRIHALDAAAALAVTPTSRAAAAITQTIVGDGVTSTTVQRT